MLTYIDCGSGIAGDMLLGSLIGLGLPPRELERTLQAALKEKGWSLKIAQTERQHWPAWSLPSLHQPSVSVALARLQVPVRQCVGLLQRSPMAPALQVQPAPAESWAQRPSLQSASSWRSQGVPTAPSLQVPSLLPPPLRQWPLSQCSLSPHG